MIFCEICVFGVLLFLPKFDIYEVVRVCRFEFKVNKKSSLLEVALKNYFIDAEINSA